MSSIPLGYKLVGYDAYNRPIYQKGKVVVRLTQIVKEPFANWKQSDVEAFNRRGNQPAILDACEPVGVDKESDLHNDIIAACRSRGWQYLHGSMAAETHRTLGEPDFIILADRGRVHCIECKRRGGKLSPAQLAFKVQAEKNGHTVHVAYSMDDFNRITTL